ncbi:hypothetical protein GGI11_006006, partial [Coemansia sp. RSA 2049]
YKQDITLEDGMAIVRKCIDAMQKRFLNQMSTFTIKVIDAQGTREIDISEA